jgi:hypothetical protein
MPLEIKGADTPPADVKYVLAFDNVATLAVPIFVSSG